MKPYSVDLREKVVNAYHSGNISVRKLAVNFGVGKAFVQKMLKQYQEQGHVNPGKQGTRKKAVLAESTTQLVALVEKYPDATLSEYCEYWLLTQGQLVSTSMMCRELQKLNLTRKKKRLGAVKRLSIESSYSDVNTERKSEI
ncbi:helix-turn-helix domain-containing protein [Nostoc sp. CCY0012]|uniref:helix-turn-helix domain-containing protein n=1 Tax=Nostoc sp. CCY0012 TaxID=1056123 RepID=UPI0039C6DA2F